MTVLTGIQILKCGYLLYLKSIYRYQEILTDPSYAGQFVLMTQPHIGNTGINLGTSSNSFVPKCDFDIQALYVSAT